MGVALILAQTVLVVLVLLAHVVTLNLWVVFLPLILLSLLWLVACFYGVTFNIGSFKHPYVRRSRR